MVPLGDYECQCGRVWRVEDGDKSIWREPGKIRCNCGRIIAEWSGSREYVAIIVKGLAGDDLHAKAPCSYE
jgi:hypothetical protein